MFRGSAVTTDNTIYAVPFSSHDIYCYHVKENLWSKRHNRCPQKNFGLAVFGSKLTAIGGKDASGHVTGKVLTLQQGKWIEELPPLLQPRSLPAVVSTDSHLLAIGGFTTTSGGGGCNSVELLHRGDQAWTSLTSLPTPTDFPSATLIGEHIYIMTDREHGFLSSLADVLANKKPLPLLTWQPLPPFPRTVRSYTPSSCSLGGQLVIVDSDGTIYQSLHGKWEKCGHLSGECRGLCLLASPSPHTMVAVGGGYSIYSSYVYRIGCDDEFTVDECTV